MIELSKKWKLTSGPYDNDFCLIELKEGKNPKTGEATVTEGKTYHPNLQQVSNKIANSECIDALNACDTLQELMAKLDEVRTEVYDASQK